ncbi:MAG: hypothetical protein Q9208_006297 [Pyrenodesmia sp. 3 TL-2023]
MSESATFINVVHFIKALGQGDFHGEIRPRNFRTFQCPSPLIGLRVPPNHPTIKRAFVIWGLQVAINHMYQEQATPTFWTSHYTLLWNDEEIGGLSFGLAEEQASQKITPEEPVEGITARNDPETDSSIVTRQTSGVANLTTHPAELSTDLTNNGLSVAYTFTGRPLSKVDLYFVLLWVMAEASRPASDTRIMRNWTPPWLEDLELHTMFSASAVHRTTPPFMTYDLLLEAVAGAADFLVAQNRFGELRVQLAVDGVAIGQGLFRHRPVQST